MRTEPNVQKFISFYISLSQQWFLKQVQPIQEVQTKQVFHSKMRLVANRAVRAKIAKVIAERLKSTCRINGNSNLRYICHIQELIIFTALTSIINKNQRRNHLLEPSDSQLASYSYLFTYLYTILFMIFISLNTVG